jgi:hypothetical protein
MKNGKLLRVVALMLLSGLLAVCLGAMEFALKEATPVGELQPGGAVDINLGATPESYVRSMVKQLTGQEPPPSWVEEHARLLGTGDAPRRIDLAVRLAEQVGMDPPWRYSDPWQEQTAPGPRPEKRLKRDIGAVFMFFFSSPTGPNGGYGWANNHVPGMFEPVERLRFPGDVNNPHSGFYHPLNPGFWYQEMLDARYAGLDFLLLNAYGPDITDGSMERLNKALQRLEQEGEREPPGIALFDDTWTWTQPYFWPFWQQQPDCADGDATAELLYTAKWKPFFSKVPQTHWYRFKGRPFIYFYNSGTLANRDQFAPVLKRMKALFAEDFGVEPFVVVDSAFSNSKGIAKVADAEFVWDTFRTEKPYFTSKRNGIKVSHSMIRWDSISRDNKFKPRRASRVDRLVKDDRILKQVLAQTKDSDILVLATWNDLGEGTGINRSYDYFWDGQWQKPTFFMEQIRASQAGTE